VETKGWVLHVKGQENVKENKEKLFKKVKIC
jgi:hypothetical protein